MGKSKTRKAGRVELELGGGAREGGRSNVQLLSWRKKVALSELSWITIMNLLIIIAKTEFILRFRL